MSPRVAATNTLRRLWPMLAVLGAGLVGYGMLKQRVADAATAIARVEKRQDKADAIREKDREKVEAVDREAAALTTSVNALAGQVGTLSGRIDTLLDRLAEPPPPYPERHPPRR